MPPAVISPDGQAHVVAGAIIGMPAIDAEQRHRGADDSRSRAQQRGDRTSPLDERTHHPR